MKKKLFRVVGYSDCVREGKSSFRVLHCVGEPFYSNHEGECCINCFCDIEDGYEVGDEITVLKAGKNYVVC